MSVFAFFGQGTARARVPDCTGPAATTTTTTTTTTIIIRSDTEFLSRYNVACTG